MLKWLPPCLPQKRTFGNCWSWTFCRPDALQRQSTCELPHYHLWQNSTQQHKIWRWNLWRRPSSTTSTHNSCCPDHLLETEILCQQFTTEYIHTGNTIHHRIHIYWHNNVILTTLTTTFRFLINQLTYLELMQVRLVPKEFLLGLMQQIFTGWMSHKTLNELESLTQNQMSSTVCLRLYSDGSSICYSSICDLCTPNLTHSSLSHNTSLVENPTNTV